MKDLLLVLALVCLVIGFLYYVGKGFRRAAKR